MTQMQNNIDDNNAKKPSETGAYLKSIRLQKNLSEDDIYSKLKIKARIISAIENHHYNNLPDTVTVAALVRQYASFLGLDGVITSNNYKKEMIGTDQKIEVIFPDKLPTSFKPFKQSILLTFVCIALYSIWRLLNDTDNLLPQIMPTQDVQTATSAKNVSQKIEKTKISTAYKTVSQNIIPVIHFKIMRTPDIFIKANNGQSWIEIKEVSNKRIIHSAILQAGQTYKIPSDINGLRLKAGNTAPLSIIVNDEVLPILPRNNRVLRDFNIDSENLLKLYNQHKSNTAPLKPQ